MYVEIKKYEYIDHIADVKFMAYGQTIEKAFQNAALAIMNVMIKTDTISNNIVREITLEAFNLDDLLFDWLSEFLYFIDAENIIFGQFEVHKIEQESGAFKLTATIYGEYIDLEKHMFDTGVKAPTYNEMYINETESGWVLQAVVDI